MGLMARQQTNIHLATVELSLQLGGQQGSLPNRVVHPTLNLHMQVDVSALGRVIQARAKQTHLSPISPAKCDRLVNDGL
jgi:hypothetical protein